MADILEKLVADIKETCGQDLKSIILYGSKASGEDTEKHSDSNLLLVLEKVSLKELKSIGVLIRQWLKKGNPPPVIFTTERLIESADIFPMEFYDMQENSRILFGINPFQGLKIDSANLRHECEFELQGKLLKLRSGCLAAKSRDDFRKLLIGSISTFLIIFRHLVRLLGETPPRKRLETLEILSAKAGLNPSVFRTIFNMKKGDKEALKQDPEGLMEEYLEEIEKIVKFVDKI